MYVRHNTVQEVYTTLYLMYVQHNIVQQVYTALNRIMYDSNDVK